MHSSVEGTVDWVSILAIVNSIAIHMAKQVSLWQDIESFGYMTRSDTSGPCCTSDFNFFEEPPNFVS